MGGKAVIRTESAPAPFRGAPYSQAIRWGELVFVSGQVAVDPTTNEVVEGGIAEQTQRVMENIAAVLEAAGTGLPNLVKTTIYLADFDDFGAMNEVYARYVGDEPPARATVEVSSLPAGARLEIDAIAHL